MKNLVHESIVQEYRYAVSPERLYRALSGEIGSWWTHRFKEGSRVLLEPSIGGAFREEWQGGGALYARVTYLEQDRKIRLSGPMGMPGAVAASVEFTLEAENGSTRLALAHDILGWLEAGTVEDYVKGWKELLGANLRSWVEGRDLP